MNTKGISFAVLLIALAFGAGVVLIAAFLWTARRKGEAALIDLRLFQSDVFSTVAVAQFLSNGAMFAGQMLIPAFLIQTCGRAPGEMGWLLAPLGIGMMVVNPLIGALIDRFGIRRVSAGGALLALAATAPMLMLALRGLDLVVLVPALLMRGAGMGAVGLPGMAAAYASVDRSRLPMATTSLNVVQRLGGPALTTLCASFLAWQLGPQVAGPAASSAYVWAFALLCSLHALTFLVAIRLPRTLGAATIRA